MSIFNFFFSIFTFAELIEYPPNTVIQGEVRNFVTGRVRGWWSGSMWRKRFGIFGIFRRKFLAGRRIPDVQNLWGLMMV